MKDDYERIAAAIRFIDSHVSEQPDVSAIAQATGLSVAHCVRLFRRWAGVSPKRFLQYLTVAHARALLDQSATVLDAAVDSGLSGPSRLHDHFVTIEAMTPGDYKSGGKGLQLRYGMHDSPFGPMLVAVSDRGICALSFCDSGSLADEVERLRRRWPAASMTEDRRETAAVAARLRAPAAAQGPLSLLVSGTNFQVRIWEALLRVPAATVCSYGRLAELAGQPGSARATGAAVGANPIAWLIPCHRVIRSTGVIGDYRWGAERKKAMLGWEAARGDTTVALSA